MRRRFRTRSELVRRAPRHRFGAVSVRSVRERIAALPEEEPLFDEWAAIEAAHRERNARR